MAKKELLIEKYIDSEGIEDDEDDDGHGFELDEPMVEDEEETKPAKKHSTKMTKDKNIAIDGEELKADKTLVKKHVMKCITKGVTKKAYHKFLSKLKENPRKYIEEEQMMAISTHLRKLHLIIKMIGLEQWTTVQANM